MEFQRTAMTNDAPALPLQTAKGKATSTVSIACRRLGDGMVNHSCCRVAARVFRLLHPSRLCFVFYLQRILLKNINRTSLAITCLNSLFEMIFLLSTLQGEFSVPYAAHDICNQREKLREQREHVMLVVRAYNSKLLASR